MPPQDRTVRAGEVNGKNSYGAYTGFKSFLYADGTVVYAGDATFMSLLNRCYGRNEDFAKGQEPSLLLNSGPASAPDEEPARDAGAKPTSNLMDHDTEADWEAALSSKERCWMGYCPCDTSDPYYGGADVLLWRQQSAGLPGDEEMMSAAAALRDARKQLREHQERYGSFDDY